MDTPRARGPRGVGSEEDGKPRIQGLMYVFGRHTHGTYMYFMEVTQSGALTSVSRFKP